MMPDDFPLVDLSGREDMTQIFEMIRRHAYILVQKELEKDGMGSDKGALTACQQAIDKWINSAQNKLEPNLSVNGMKFSDSGTEKQAFDKELSQRVQQLTEQSDNLTAQVIAARKSLPARRAAALQKRLEVIQMREARLEELRRAIEVNFKKEVEAEEQKIDVLERAIEISSTLETAVKDIEMLAVDLLEQNSAAQEQVKLVKRIRTMAASSL